MHLQTGADIALVIFVAIFALIAVGALVGLAIALNKLTQQVEKITHKLDPVITKTTTTLDTVQRATTTIAEKADHILSRGEELTDNVTQQVEKTATVVEKTVTGPLINLSSLITGVSTGFSVWSHAMHNGRTNGRAKVYDGSVTAERTGEP